jgi:hypothetical protein
VGIADVVQTVTPARVPARDQETNWLDALLANSSKYPAAAPSTYDRVRGVVALRRDQVEAAEDLIRRRYAWRGYALCGDAGALAAPFVTLLAQSGDEVVGTLSVRPGGAQGLLAEDAYGVEIERLRGEGRRVGELVRLAIEERGDWRPALDALVQSAYVVTRFMHALTDVVIEVNPRHVRFYQRVFGFVAAAAERFCTRVGAPSVLMLLDLDQFGRRLQSIKL